MGRSIAILSVLLLLATAGGASAAPASPTPAPGAPPAGAPTQPPSAPPDNYILGVGDQIDVNVFGEPDLSRTVTIKPDGIIALPLINQVKAGGKTVPQLEAELAGMYAKYLRSPSVSIIVRQFRMPRVYVMGEVTKPGRYDLTEDMSVLDALTAAGGPTDKGNLDGLQLARVENGKSKAIPVKMNQVVQGKDAQQNLKLQNGDLVYVPRRGMSLLEILQSIGALRMVLGLF
jgi:polysaccharide biosynthesis/export protein